MACIHGDREEEIVHFGMKKRRNDTRDISKALLNNQGNKRGISITRTDHKSRKEVI